MLAQIPPTPQPTLAPQDYALLLLLLLLTLSSPIIAWWAGLFRRPGLLAGPVRYGPGDTVGWFVMVLCAGFLVWVSATMLIGEFLKYAAMDAAPFVAGLLGMFVGFWALFLANATLRPRGLAQVGLLGRMVPAGLLGGIAGLLIVLPWILWLLVAAQFILQRLGIEIEAPHEVFRKLQQPDVSPLFRIVAPIGAILIAPLFEEILFRGTLQTALTRLLAHGRLAISTVQTIPAPMPPPMPYLSPAPLDYASSEPAPYHPELSLIPGRGARWLAIIITSLCFALVHEPLSQPAIFLLSVGLGYLYERTGNLWAPIFMHALFNAVQFSLFIVVHG